MTEDPLLTSLLAAVAAAPDDVPLRLHVAEQLAAAGRIPEALQHATSALAAEPGHAGAIALLQRLTAGLATGGANPADPADHTDAGPADPAPEERPAGGRPAAEQSSPGEPSHAQPPRAEFDWDRAEEQVADIAEPVAGFGDGGGIGGSDDSDVEWAERPDVRLDDVGGMEHVKERLELAFLGPVRNPEMARAFGKRPGGGLLLYGPPGCGKTFLARAVAGELGARFTAVGIADVLDMWIGRSERNLARDLRAPPAATRPACCSSTRSTRSGQKRSPPAHSGELRNTVNQLLSEMDSLSGRNDGVFVLAATNHPWDIDPALRRPGRFDRMLLVLPPDPAARAAILRHHLRDRPVDRPRPGPRRPGHRALLRRRPRAPRATPPPSARWPTRCAAAGCAR